MENKSSVELVWDEISQMCERTERLIPVLQQIHITAAKRSVGMTGANEEMRLIRQREFEETIDMEMGMIKEINPVLMWAMSDYFKRHPNTDFANIHLKNKVIDGKS